MTQYDIRQMSYANRRHVQSDKIRRQVGETIGLNCLSWTSAELRFISRSRDFGLPPGVRLEKCRTRADRGLDVEYGQPDCIQGLDGGGVAQVVELHAGDRDLAVAEQLGYLGNGARRRAPARRTKVCWRPCGARASPVPSGGRAGAAGSTRTGRIPGAPARVQNRGPFFRPSPFRGAVQRAGTSSQLRWKPRGRLVALAVEYAGAVLAQVDSAALRAAISLTWALSGTAARSGPGCGCRWRTSPPGTSAAVLVPGGARGGLCWLRGLSWRRAGHSWIVCSITSLRPGVEISHLGWDDPPGPPDAR